MTIAIEKNIPLPGKRAGAGNAYPFDDMEVGDSFSVPFSGESWGKWGDKSVSRVSAACAAYSKKHNRKFVTRTFKHEGIIRCWRIA